jgi:hypothetical protein
MKKVKLRAAVMIGAASEWLAPKSKDQHTGPVCVSVMMLTPNGASSGNQPVSKNVLLHTHTHTGPQMVATHTHTLANKIKGKTSKPTGHSQHKYGLFEQNHQLNAFGLRQFGANEI